MGKAAIVGGTLVVLAIIVGLVIMWFRRQDDDGNLSKTEENVLLRQLDLAARIMYEAGPADDIDYSDILSERTKGAIAEWLHDYGKLRKELNA